MQALCWLITDGCWFESNPAHEHPSAWGLFNWRNMSEATTPQGVKNLIKAHALAYAEIDNVVKNAHNPHHGNNYADLAAVNNVVRPVFAKHGLTLMQAPGRVSEIGGKFFAGLTGVLGHGPSGEMMAFEMHVPLGDKLSAQQYVAAMTYGRRCQKAGIAGIAQTDDDGNEASDVEEKPRKKKSKAAEEAPEDDAGYAAKRDALIARIEACTDAAELGTEKDPTPLRGEVNAMGDQVVIDAYIAKAKELRKKGKKA